MIALEKLLLLKSVILFKQTPDDLLMEVVNNVVKEEMFKADTLVLQKGDTGTFMYLIVHGRVRIHDEKMLIAEVGEREIFGELSALNGEPRVASVSTISDCLFLKICSKGLYALMHFDNGLAKGIIHALCQRTALISLQMQKLLHEHHSLASLPDLKALPGNIV